MEVDAETNAIFRQVADASPDWESWLAPDGALRWVSPAVTRVTGYSIEACMAMPDYPQAMVLQSDQPDFQLFHESVGKRLPGSNLPVRLRRKDGAVIWVLVSWQPFTDANGEYLGVRISICDVSKGMHNRYFNQLRLASSRVMHDAMNVVGDLEQVYRLITACAAQTLGVARVGVWLFDKSHQYLVCANLFSLGGNSHVGGISIPVARCPRYIAAISSEQRVVVNDVMNDAVTQELVNSYLKPLGIASMLDVPIVSAGRPIGVLCHEHVGNIRYWSQPEIAFAESLSDFLTLSLESSKRIHLENQTQQLASIFEATPDLVATVALDGKPLYLNRAGFQLLGGGEDFNLAKFNISDIYSPEALRLRDEVAVPAALRDGYWNGESTLYTLAGEEVPIWQTLIAHRDADGKVKFMSSVIRDLREQKRLEEHTRRLASIIEATPDAVITVAADGTTLYLNRAAIQAQQPKGDNRAAEFKTGTLGEFYSAEALHFRKEVVIPAALRDGHWSGEIRVRTLTGEEIPVWQTMIAHRDFDGSVKYFSSVLRDLREQKQVEAQLRDREHSLELLNVELETRIAERTQKVEEVNRNLEAFAYSVAHDLKAPLRGIDGYARLLMEDYREQLPGEAPQFVDNICTAADRMHQLIDDLLEFSRIGRRELSTTRFSIAQVLERILTERQHDIDSRGLQIVSELKGIEIAADLDCFMQLLRNLVDNAIKFTRETVKPVVKIAATQDDKCTLISVQDNGCGFDMKYHDRIFSIFQRLHRVEEYPGTGIGLAIVSKSAERMGGRVWAQSEPGRGAEFFVELPR
jgi:PAS domain S-box-containing protein